MVNTYMSARRNPTPNHVRPEVVERLRRRIDKTGREEWWNNVALAARAAAQSKQNINYAKMAERNTLAAVMAKKYKIALQIAMRRQGIKNKTLYHELNQYFFDLSRTPGKKNSTVYQREIFDAIEKTLTQHKVPHREFFHELKRAVEDLSQ